MLRPDHVDPPGSSHAEHPPAGQERPCCPARAHEERPGSDEDPETHGGWCHPSRSVNGPGSHRGDMMEMTCRYSFASFKIVLATAYRSLRIRNEVMMHVCCTP